MFNRFISFLFLILLASCGQKTKPNDDAIPSIKIAFGSCSDQQIKEQMWSEIKDQNPDLFVFTGDIIYVDNLSPAEMKAAYDKQKNNEDYQKLLEQTKIIGIWDDHDYGVNDGGKNNSRKTLNKELLLEFLDVASTDSVRSHEGVYFSHNLRHFEKNIKLILLDTRSFRDTLMNDSMSSSRYLINEKGDILGEGQWQWLSNELQDTSVDLFILASGIQIIAEEQPFEKWSNFPNSRKRLFNLIQKTKPKNLILLSGDRHIAEISSIQLPGLNYPLFEFTSSGLTHAFDGELKEKNKYRILEPVNRRNYGQLILDWKHNVLNINFEVKGHGDSTFLKHNINFN